MILSIGEILADMIGRPDGDNGTVTFARHPGGAPFNVACNLKKLGASVGFCGRVGDDLMGDYLADFAASCGLDVLCLQKDAHRNTTLAFVELAPDGERSFCFYRKGTADYHIDPVALESAIAAADIIHLGSLMLSEPAGRDVADTILLLARKHQKRISFDVNYRADIFDSPAEAVATYRRYIAAADIVKYSEDELCLFTGYADMDDALAALQETDSPHETAALHKSNALLFVTRGKQGSLCLSGGRIYTAPTIPVTCVDTTGAGDAFFAGVLSVLDGKPVPSPDDLIRALRIGNICGALATTAHGSIHDALSAEAVAGAVSVHGH